MLVALSWPDILVGPGLLGGSMILSHEELVINVEIFRMCKRAHQGIVTEDKWLEDVFDRVGPGRNFLSEKSTVDGIRGGEWYLSKLGVHGTYEGWEAAGKQTLLEEARENVKQILSTHQPLPLDEEAERELDRIQERAQESPGKP
jgi:trimethylamine:corrinoid methyltransferase-like protein